MSEIIHWVVPHDHPAFAGHFPGRPIVPGVVLLDVALHEIAAERGLTLDSCQISSVKFLSAVGPGESLEIQCAVSNSGGIRFDITAGPRKVASGSVTPGGRYDIA